MKVEQFNFNLGPFEIFSSTIGGLPIILCGLLFYNPITSLKDLIPIIKSSSITLLAFIIVASYFLGSLLQNFTWLYFKAYCKLFKKKHTYLGDLMMEKIKDLQESDLSNPNIQNLDFEDRLSMLIIRKVGRPQKLRWLEARLLPYIRQNDPISANILESYMANHIMYRNISFGFFMLMLISIFNIFRISSYTLEQIILVLLFLMFSYMAGHKAVDFRAWRNRDLYISFYHLAQNN